MKMSNQREAYGDALVALGKENSRIVVCEADLGKVTMTHAFGQAYPERYLEMGISSRGLSRPVVR